MQTEVFALPMVLTCQEANDRIRSRADSESVYYIYCVDEENTLVGVVSLRELVRAPATKPLSEIMKKDLVTVRPDATSEEVAKLVGHYDYIALPVTTETGELLGLVTVDNVIDILQSQAAAQMYAQVGLQERDRIYSSARQSTLYRLPWMVLNLATAFAASFVVAQFEETMSQLIVLATLNNVVAGMGGNQAIQTLTVMTRGLATGDFNFITPKRALFKELAVGLMSGLVVGLLGGLVVFLWKGQAGVAVILFCAMLINAVIATGMGAIVPVLLKRLGFDPASGSGVIITFATDVCGFLSFLGIATLVLKYFSHL
jgi:magnesium transporter